MTTDPQAGLGIAWNAIGLPRTITASAGTGSATTQRSNLADGSLSQVSDGSTARLYLGDMVFNTVIPRNIRISEAPSHGVPVILYDPDCRGSISHMQLAQEIISRDKKS